MDIDFDHVMLDVSYYELFNVKGSKVKVTAWHNVSAGRKRMFSNVY